VKRVLFVCLGNICRSPAGENVFRDLVAEAGLSDAITCDSAGVMGWHEGKGPDDRMQAALSERGFSSSGSARQVSAEDFERFDLILAMDRDNFAALEKLNPVDGHGAELRLFCDFVENYEDEEVPDPYYGGDAGFQHVIDLMVDGCDGILEKVRGVTG